MSLRSTTPEERNLCVCGKVPYFDHKDAEIAMQKIIEKDQGLNKNPGNMHPYKCPLSDNYHFGHSAKSSGARRKANWRRNKKLREQREKAEER